MPFREDKKINFYQIGSRPLLSASKYLVVLSRSGRSKERGDKADASGRIEPYPRIHYYLGWRFNSGTLGKHNVATGQGSVSAMPDATVEDT